MIAATPLPRKEQKRVDVNTVTRSSHIALSFVRNHFFIVRLFSLNSYVCCT